MSGERPIAAGASSFGIVDVGGLFRSLDLSEGTVLLDLACGRGDYAFEAARHVGEGGVVYAVDLWEEGIRLIEERIRDGQTKNVRPLLADVSRHIPLADRSVDVCLMAAVLHDLLQDGTAEGALGEVRRCVRPGGRLAVVEFKVMDGPPGPPRAVRIDESRVDGLVTPHGFSLRSAAELGAYAYLRLFEAAPA